MMRLFFAIPLEPEIREAVAAVQTRLRATDADVKWVEPASFHLTVSFLGDREDSQLSDLSAIGESLAATTKPFRFRVSGASSFPRRSPLLKTILVGVPEGAEEWKALVKRAEPQLLPFGVPREGGLQPHITLGRVKSERNIEALRDAISLEAKTDCGAQSATTLELVQSFLDPRGATYKTLKVWRFNETIRQDLTPGAE